MYRYGLCVTIGAVIWIVNGKWLIHAIKNRVISECYIHTGLGIFFSLLVLELTLGGLRLWARMDILSLKIIGFLLYIPSAYLVGASMSALKHKGRSKTRDFTATTTFLETGIYAVIRQPMTLGMAIWSIAVILVFQSILSVILGLPSVLFFWISARKEVDYNIEKFGKQYEEYAKRVPMWNVLKGWRK